MGYTNEDSGDLDKLLDAFRDITRHFGSVDAILEAFGLADMPTAQRYGIMFGFLVFTCTVTTVICLLIFGGTFKRLAEQAESGDSTMLSSFAARSQRPLLLEHLLDGRERMLSNYPPEPVTEEITNLTKMLLNVAPDPVMEDMGALVETTNNKSTTNENGKKKRYMPPLYQENYLEAYRKCQDRPGGTMLSGKPEARFEAYARGYAGCGAYTTTAYRRSYGRIYEAICCASHKADDKYAELFRTRPYDIIGKFVRLEALQVDRHLKRVFFVTSGEPALDSTAYDPEEIWGFLPEGPFQNPQAMRKSFVFQHKRNEAAFAVVNSVTDTILGAVRLTNDCPVNLSIQLEPPILQPALEGTKEQLEACFLLLDRLFAFGYRRIQFSIDSQDNEKRKLAARLGFAHEGVLYKHMVVKEANRDSSVYSLLNSDWNKGARAALFRKLYGASALATDMANEKKETELEERQRALDEQKVEAAAAAKLKGL